MRAHVLYWLRQAHLYIGVFTAPALLFFAFTGTLQTLSLNDRSPDGAYTPPHWISVLAQIHKKQTAQLPARRPQGDGASRPQKVQDGDRRPAPPPENQAPPKPVALKAFFILVCVSLFASTFSGVWMAWKLRRNKLVLVGLAAAGIIVPLALIKF